MELATKNNKNELIQIRVTEYEKKEIKDAAAKRDLSISDLVKVSLNRNCSLTNEIVLSNTTNLLYDYKEQLQALNRHYKDILRYEEPDEEKKEYCEDKIKYQDRMIEKIETNLEDLEKYFK